MILGAVEKFVSANTTRSQQKTGSRLIINLTSISPKPRAPLRSLFIGQFIVRRIMRGNVKNHCENQTIDDEESTRRYTVLHACDGNKSIARFLLAALRMDNCDRVIGAITAFITILEVTRRYTDRSSCAESLNGGMRF